MYLLYASKEVLILRINFVSVIVIICEENPVVVDQTGNVSNSIVHQLLRIVGPQGYIHAVEVSERRFHAGAEPAG